MGVNKRDDEVLKKYRILTGLIIKNCRLKKGWTRSFLAEKLDRRPETIWSFETGRTRLYDDDLQLIIILLGINNFYEKRKPCLGISDLDLLIAQEEENIESFITDNPTLGRKRID